MTFDTLLAACFAGFLGGLFRGYSGFGFSMGAVPILSIFVPPALVVPSSLFIELAIAAFTFRGEQHHVDLKVIKPILLGALVGTPVGLWALAKVTEDVMRLFLGLALSASVYVVWHTRRVLTVESPVKLIPFGLVSGLLNGGSAMSGPPVILALMATRLAASKIRGTLIFFIGCSAFIGIVLATIAGLQNWTTVYLAMVMSPPALIGAWIGSRVFKIYMDRGYRTIGLIFLFCVAVIAICSGLWGMIFSR